MRCPITKFFTHTMSHMAFLFLLAAATFGLEERINVAVEHTNVNTSQLRTSDEIDVYLRATFRPMKLLSGSIITYGQMVIACFVLGEYQYLF